MRFVELTIPAGKRDAVLGVLDEEGIDYVLTDEVSGREYTAVVSFPLPTAAVEPVLDRLREVGLDDDAFTVVLAAETVVSRRFERLEERYAEEAPDEDRIAREEILSRANGLIPGLETYVALTVVSVAIATAGVLLDSAAVVVGSMVIAPLIGPAMSTSVGTVLRDRELFVRGVKLQLLGFGVALATAAVFAFLVRGLNLVPPGLDVVAIGQVSERLSPDFLSLAIALGAGAAGAYSLSSDISSALVGVAIAVALIPPTAVVGIGVAWGLPAVVLGASVLVLVNVFSINLAALAILWYQGYRPTSWFQAEEARGATLRRLGALLVILLVLSVPLGAATYSGYRTATVEEDIRTDVRGVIAGPAYPEVRLLDLRVTTAGPPFLAEPDRAVVTLSKPPGTTYPDLVDALAARIGTDGRTLTLEVRFVESVRRPAA